MQNPIFTFDAESAKVSGPGGASETGAYTGFIRTALFTDGRDSQSQSIELSLDADVGSINYLRISYVGRDGNPLKGGTAMVNAIMGLTKVKQLFATEVQGENGPEYHCKELEGKPIGFVLQKVLYTKTGGGDGYRFEIRQAFGVNTRKTFKEAVDNLPAEAVNKLLATLNDKDERQAQTHSGIGGANQNQPSSMLGGTNNGWGQPQQPQSRLQQAAGNRNQQPQPEPDFDDDIPF
ncbi:hypothetical protein [uncultured Pantoea sp.]|uniref:hypothetical protein n=1 Tax=uncultured Pantoea sp. TaxID=218084 RepID=UPI0025CEB581|nr:hypothetical protein [uncultured Pantoea sp.]